MGGKQSTYRKEMKEAYPNMVATWPPDDFFRLGDYGKINQKDGTFNYIGNIKDIGIEFQKIKNPPGTYHKLQSKGTSSTKVDLGGIGSNGKVNGEAALEYSFEKEFSCLYHGNNPVVTRIKDVNAVAEDVEKLRRKNKFKSDYWILCETIEVDGLVVTVAKGKKSSLTVSGSAKAISSGDIAAHGQVSLSNEKEMVHTFNKTKPGSKCTPMAKLFKVRIKGKRSDVVFAKTAKTNGMAANATEDEEDETFIELGKYENGESYGIEYFSFTTAGENDEDESQEQATTGMSDTA